MKPFKPMLASEADLTKLRFPLLASPKFDGIRCVVHPELGAVTRNLKPIPNVHIRNLLDKHARGLDGELVVGDPTAKDCFQKTTSAVMSSKGTPEFTFWAFDRPFENCEFIYRWGTYAAGQVNNSKEKWLRLVPHVHLEDPAALEYYESVKVLEGWEGVMLRDPCGRYKQGRSTVKEGGLLKLKRFRDAEAIVVGFEEQMHNGNEATVNALGHTQRSSHKENLRAKGTLGALVCAWPSVGAVCEPFFNIGTGFTQAQRDEIWAKRDDLKWKTIKFKYQAVGTDQAPRFPVFLGFRPEGA